MCDKICGNCEYAGRVYHSDGLDIFDHSCEKQSIRRKEAMSPNADFMDHFRAFFDCRANQKACNHYSERNSRLNEDQIKVLRRIANKEDICLNDKDYNIAYKMDDMYVSQNEYYYHCKEYETNKYFRQFKIIPMGKVTLDRQKDDYK